MSDLGSAKVIEDAEAVSATWTIPQRLPAGYLPRSRLLNIFNRAEDGAVLVLTAPPGYGKTALLAEHAQGTTHPYLWLTLTRGAASHGLERLVRAACNPAHGLDPLLLRGRGTASFAAALVNAIHALQHPMDIIFDGIDRLEPGDLTDIVLPLVRDWPNRSRLLLSSRGSHTLPLGRLRLQRSIHEIGPSELAFSPSEIEDLVRRHNIPVSPNSVSKLHSLTGGWIAPLQLALAPKDHPLSEQSLLHSLETSADISAYLEEIIGELPENAQHVLHAICICDEISTELAAALTNDPTIGTCLKALSRQSALLFAPANDRPNFKMLLLVRKHLASELRLIHPLRFRTLHRTAANWFAEQGDIAQALIHTTQAGDVEEAARLLNLHASTLLLSGHYSIVRQAFELLSARHIAANALLCLAMAMACLETGELDIADIFIDKAHAIWPEEPQADLIAFSSSVRLRRAWLSGGSGDEIGEPRSLDELSRLPKVPRRDDAGLLAPPMTMAQHALPSNSSGSTKTVDSAGSNPYLETRSLIFQGLATAAEGDLNRTLQLVLKAEAIISANAWNSSELKAHVTLLRMLVALLRGDPATCLALATEARQTSSALDIPLLRPPIQTCLGAALFDIGERSRGLEMMRSIRLSLPENFIMPTMVALSASFECQAAMTLGHVGDAKLTLEWTERRIPESGEILLMRASLASFQGKYMAASRTLRPVLDGLRPGHLAWTVGQAWLLECEISLRTENRRNAGLALTQALALFRKTTVTRPMAYAAPEVLQFLAQQIGNLDQDDEFAREWLAAHKSSAGEPPPTLTEREWTVLHALPTHLSLKEIAEGLSVSVNTVKTHVKSIYAKLGAESRRAAVAKSYRLGLLIEHRTPHSIE